MMLTGKLTPFTGRGKMFTWRVTKPDGRFYLASMTVPDATHAARAGTSLELVKETKK